MERKNAAVPGQTLEQVLATSESTIDAFNRSVREFRDQLDKAEIDKQDELIDVLKSNEHTINQLLEENSILKDRVKEAATINNDSASSNAQLQALKVHIDRLKAETAKLVERITMKDNTIKQLESELQKPTLEGASVDVRPLQQRINELERVRATLTEAKAELTLENQSLQKTISQLELELQTTRGELEDAKLSEDYLRIQTKYLDAVEENNNNVQLIRELRQQLTHVQESSRSSVNESLRQVQSKISEIENRRNVSSNDHVVQELRKELERAYEENQQLKDRNNEVDLSSIQEEIAHVTRLLTSVLEAFHRSTFDAKLMSSLKDFCDTVDLKTKLLDSKLQLNISKSQSKKLTLKLSEKEHLLDQAAQLVAILQEENDSCKEELAKVRTPQATKKQVLSHRKR